MSAHGHGNPHHIRQTHASHGSHRQLHGDQRLAAASYLLGPFSGLAVYMLADQRDKYARWHAMQSILVGLGLALVGLVAAMLALNDIGTTRGLLGMSTAMSVYWIGALAVVGMLAIAAYRGDRVRVPYAANFADKHS